MKIYVMSEWPISHHYIWPIFSVVQKIKNNV